MPKLKIVPRRVCAGLGVALLGLCAGAAHAQEQGTLSVEIGGAPATFALWAEQSDWSGPPGFHSINIYARPADAAAEAVASQFTLGFALMQGAAQDGEASARVAGGTQLWTEDEQGGFSVTLEESAADGDLLAVSGSFAGQMGPSDNFGIDIDLSAPVSLSGTFAVTLGPIE